jgi:urease accessory protein
VERVYKFEMGQQVFDMPFGHFAPAFGAVLSVLNVSREVVVRMFFFNHLRSILAAAVRLNIIGPIEGQMLQRDLSPVCEQVIGRCEPLTLADIAQTSALIDLWQGTQGRLYSRLFQS